MKQKSLALAVAARAQRMAAKTGLSLQLCVEMATHQVLSAREGRVIIQAPEDCR